MAEQPPLHAAIYLREEKRAMEILSTDMEFFCGNEDSSGRSYLYLAITYGLSQLAEKILMSSCDYSISSGKDSSSALHHAPKCSENVLRLLLQKHSDLVDIIDDHGNNILHEWARIGQTWPLKLLIEKGSDFNPTTRTKIFTHLIYCTKKNGESPLHMAVGRYLTNFAKALILGYNTCQQERTIAVDRPPPWRLRDAEGNTPLILALSEGNEELALYYSSLDPVLSQIQNDSDESPLLLALSQEFEEVAQQILKVQGSSCSLLRKYDGLTVLHFLSTCSENLGRQLLEKYWWMVNLRDDEGKTPLERAKEADIPGIMNLLMNPSLIKKEPFDWLTACKRDETWAVLAFIDNYDLQRVYREQIDTPLHHIKLKTLKDYFDFLNIPSIAELKNSTDAEGATPLHRALERKDMFLARALLVDTEVERNIKDFDGTTAMNLLAKLCQQNDNWAQMCKQIKVNPLLKTIYIQPGTNLDQMRNTLSVVAALLATITFAAGFTLPGGLNSDTGKAVLGKKAAFLVFLLSDAYAMCTSMFVLFCLIWSMVSERDMSHFLVDRSVVILVYSLYGTMLAFMTGVYTVIDQSSLWAAIIIFVICSLVVVSANRTVLHHILAKLIPATNRTKKDRAALLEEGKAFASGDDNAQKVE